MKLALDTKAGWFIGLWMASIVIYCAFIPMIVDKNVFSSSFPIMAIFIAIIVVPIFMLNYLPKNKKENCR